MKKQIKQWLDQQSTVKLFPEEKTFIEENGLANNQELIEVETNRFEKVYIERLLKETEEMVQEENSPFLDQPIQYLRKSMDEFIYVEADAFELLKIEGISLEVEDIFEVYSVLLGLKVKKKQGDTLFAYFDEHVKDDIAKYSIMFNQADGLWDVNFTLDYIDGFHEEMTLKEAYELIYRFLFQLMVTLEQE